MSRLWQSRIDEEEFKKIARGRIRKDLRRYLSRGGILIPRDGKTVISIPVEEIEIPTFRYGYPEYGIGRGKGEEGDDLGPAPEEGDEGGKEGGRGHGGRRIIHIDVTPEEFRQLFQEELQLPNIKPKGDRTIFEVREKWTSISKKGSPSLLHLGRTFKEALKRAISDGSYRPPERTAVVPNDDERRYKSYQEVREPKNNAVCFWKRDCSGSMGPEERRIVSYIVDLCEFWLSCFYDQLESVYIIHDDRAFEVNRQQFFAEDWGGGTTCSSALAKMLEIIAERYPIHAWNIYGTYLSDGWNWTSDNETFKRLLVESVLPIVNQFNYGQVEPRLWWSSFGNSGIPFSAPGTILKIIEGLGDIDNLASTVIGSDDEEVILNAVRVFFGKGN